MLPANRKLSHNIAFFIRKLIVPFLVISALFDLLLIHFEPMAQKERALTLGASARLTS